VKAGKKGQKKGRGRPPGSAKKKAPKEREGSPVHYEYDWSDSSTASEINSGDSDDSNYRPGQDISKKGRGAKKRKTYTERASSGSDDDNWRPGKAFPGQERRRNAPGGGRPKKIKATKVTVGPPGETKGRGRPPKEGKVEKRGRPKKKQESDNEEDEEEEKKDDDDEKKDDDDEEEEDE